MTITVIIIFSEIMYELRRIKMGDRPVTGQGNKENVEQFFQSRLSTEPVDTEQFRPEPVIVEVTLHITCTSSPVDLDYGPTVLSWSYHCYTSISCSHFFVFVLWHQSHSVYEKCLCTWLGNYFIEK